MSKPPRLCFIHVPKCAGTSVARAIEAEYGRLARRGLDARKSLVDAQRAGKPLRLFRLERLQTDLRVGRLRLLSGHYPPDLETIMAWRDRWRFVTVLRDPVARTLSQYFYNRYKDNDHFRTELSIEGQFAGLEGIGRCRRYLALFGAGEKDDLEKGVDLAKRTLDAFDRVGITERLDAFAESLSGLGLRVAFDHRRSNPRAKELRDREVSEELRERIFEWSAPDRAIYEHARQLAAG